MALARHDDPDIALTGHYWEIVESDASGNVITGGYSWNSWYSGTPGVFTIPNGSTLPCGKYYKVKLAVQNSCIPWAEISKDRTCYDKG